MNRIWRHLNSIVGDVNHVYRYMFEKICHTTFIAWCLVFVFGVTPLHAAVYAAIGYLIVSKLIVRLIFKDWGTFWKTEAFYLRATYIGWVILLPFVIATPHHWVAFAIWLAVYAILEFFNVGGYAE